jgi:hypothetical protein
MNWTVSGGGTIDSTGLFKSSGIPGTFNVRTAVREDTMITSIARITVSDSGIVKGQNFAFGSVVSASSSLQSSGWAMQNIVNGTTTSTAGDFGYTSSSMVTTNHTEWILLKLDSIRIISEVDIYGRMDAGNVGNGFPINFTIQLSQDSLNWDTVASQTNYPIPDTKPQMFFFTGKSVRYIRVTGTNLRAPINEYRMQFSEIMAYGSSATTFMEVQFPQVVPVVLDVYPSPLSGMCKLSVNLMNSMSIHLAIYSSDGKLVKTLLNENLAAGNHRVVWDGTQSSGYPVSAGVYICKLRVGNSTLSRKLIIAK